jgi:hypothetical protein
MVVMVSPVVIAALWLRSREMVVLDGPSRNRPKARIHQLVERISYPLGKHRSHATRKTRSNRLTHAALGGDDETTLSVERRGRTRRHLSVDSDAAFTPSTATHESTPRIR